MQIVKFAIIDKRTADFKVIVEDTFMSTKTLWNYFHDNISEVPKEGFMTAAKLIAGLPADAPAAVFTYVDHLIHPETGEPVENEKFSYDDFMTGVYQRRAELIKERESRCEYRVVFNLLDFLQSL